MIVQNSAKTTRYSKGSRVQIPRGRGFKSRWSDQKGRKFNNFRPSAFRVKRHRVHCGYIAEVISACSHHLSGLTILSIIHRSISICRYLTSRPTVTYGSSRRSLRQRESVSACSHHLSGLTILSIIHRSISICRYLTSRPTVTYGSSRRSLRQRESVETGMLSCSAACPGVSRLRPALSALSFISCCYAACIGRIGDRYGQELD